ncbi:unnamed protein product, partial [Cyprideis torosa]
TTTVDPSKVTIGGFSSGACFAHQFHIIHSKTISGVGLIAPRNSVNVKLVYGAFMSWSDIQLINKAFISHVWPTTLSQNNNVCWSGTLPQILSGARPYRNCGYDTVYHMFTHLYGPTMAARPASPSGVLRQFDQTPFTPLLSGMDSIGAVYIPDQCENGATCKLHFALHGCLNGRSLLGDAIATDTEYMLWADVWDVILVFPNVKITALPLNPTGCWDVMGFTGPNYCPVALPELAQLKETMTRLIKNPIAVCHAFAVVFHVIANVGFFTFTPKFIESQFRRTPAESSMATGVSSVLVQVFGMVIAGYVIKKFKPRARYITGWGCLVSALYIGGILFGMQVGCDQIHVQGDYNADTNEALESNALLNHPSWLARVEGIRNSLKGVHKGPGASRELS